MKKSIYIALCATTLLHAQAPALLPIENGHESHEHFVPEVSLIVDMSYVNRNKKQDELSGLSIPATIEDFYGQDGDGHAHGAYSPNNGFNLNYAELMFSAELDHDFSVDTVFHFSEDSVEIEEAYVTYTSVLKNLRLRGGKFYSNFGLLNNEHQHVWNFSEAPLIYQGFLGNEHLNEIGIQAQYTLGKDTVLGVELLQGENEHSFGYRSIDLSTGGRIEGSEAPSMIVTYVKSSFNVGKTSFTPGLSYVQGSSKKLETHNAKEIALDAKSSVYNAELMLRHTFHKDSFLSWQSEWMRLEKEGDEYHVEADLTNIYKQKIVQEGLYSQVLYSYDENLNFGLRYESIYKNSYLYSETSLPVTAYQRYTIMMEYKMSHGNRLRFEYSQNDALYKEGSSGFEQQGVNSFIVSLNLEIGEHRAN